MQSLVTLVEAQRRAGVRAEVLAFKGRRFGGQLRERGIPVLERQIRSKFDLPAIARLAIFLRKHEVQVVHTHLSTSTVVGCIAARLARIPSVATVHGLSRRGSYFASERLIAVSGAVREHLVAQNIPREKIDVVWNGLPTDFIPYPRAQARHEFGYHNGEIVVGTLSRLTSLKGFEEGLQAFRDVAAHHPELRYLWVGDGDGAEEARTVADSLGIADRVQFAGYQKPELALPAMDLFLFPSRKEAIGIALLEALACGLPTVATDSGGIPEVITPDVGELVSVGDVQRMTESLLSLIEDGARREAMSAAGIARVQSHFSAEAMHLGVAKVYERMLAKS